MSNPKKQRTKIEDLPDEGNELFDLSEEVLMMVGVFGGSGTSGSVTIGGESKYTYNCSSTDGSPDAPMCDTDKCTVPD